MEHQLCLEVHSQQASQGAGLTMPSVQNEEYALQRAAMQYRATLHCMVMAKTSRKHQAWAKARTRANAPER